MELRIVHYPVLLERIRQVHQRARSIKEALELVIRRRYPDLDNNYFVHGAYDFQSIAEFGWVLEIIDTDRLGYFSIELHKGESNSLAGSNYHNKGTWQFYCINGGLVSTQSSDQKDGGLIRLNQEEALKQLNRLLDNIEMAVKA